MRRRNGGADVKRAWLPHTWRSAPHICPKHPTAPRRLLLLARRANFENMGRKLVTPDDLSMFLRTLNPEKAAALAPGRILSLYVEAARAAGPASADLGRHLCRVVLESGEAGRRLLVAAEDAVSLALHFLH